MMTSCRDAKTIRFTAVQITRPKHSADCKIHFHLLHYSDSCWRFSLLMNDPISHYEWQHLGCVGLDAAKGVFILTEVLNRHTCADACVVICTFWMLRSMLSGRLKRNLKRCRTLRALRVESALSFRPRTSWKRVSAVSLAPMRGTESERGRRKWEPRILQKQMSIPQYPFNVDVWFSSCVVRYLTHRLLERKSQLSLGQAA